MEIKFKKLDGLEIEEYTIRKVTNKQTAFQALVSGKNISKNTIINFFIKYYDKDKKFLGFNEQDIWIRSNRRPVSINANVKIPDNTKFAEIEFENKKDFSSYLGWLWLGGFIFLIVTALNSIVHFW